MPDRVRVIVNGRPIVVQAGSTVAAAVLSAGHAAVRRSVTGEPRGPLCGMGICFECRAIVDGVPHTRSCQVQCRDGMEVLTDAT